MQKPALAMNKCEFYSLSVSPHGMAFVTLFFIGPQSQVSTSINVCHKLTSVFKFLFSVIVTFQIQPSILRSRTAGRRGLFHPGVYLGRKLQKKDRLLDEKRIQ